MEGELKEDDDPDSDHMSDCSNEPSLTVEVPVDDYDNDDSEIHEIHQTSISRWKYYLPILLSPVVAIVTGLLAYQGLYDYENWVVDVSHTQIANVVASQLRSTLLLTIKDCAGVSRLFSTGTEDVTVDQFKNYVEFISKDSHSYFKALEWIPYIDSPEQRDRLVKEMQVSYKERYLNVNPNSTYPEFLFYNINKSQSVLADENFPVYFVEPYEDNIVAHGLDLASNPVRLAAIKSSRATLQMVATRRVTLVQETGFQFGSLLFIPVVVNHVFKGFSLGVYRLGDLVEFSMDGVGHSGITIHLFDVTPGANNELLFSEFPHTADSEMYEIIHSPSNQRRHIIDFGTRQWELIVLRNKGFEDAKRTRTPIVTSILLSIVFGTTTLFVCGLISQSRASKRHLEIVLEVSARTAAAVSLMELDSVSFLRSLDKDAHPLLLAFRDIVNVLVEYKRFLPDVIRSKNVVTTKLTPTRERIQKCQANIALSALSQDHLINPHNLGVQSLQITAVAFSLSSFSSVIESQVNALLSTVHSNVIKRKGNVVTTVASQVHCVFTGYSISEARNVIREVMTELKQTSIVVAMTQGRCVICVAGGSLVRYPVIHGKVGYQIDELMQYARALKISALCGNMRCELPPEQFNFVDRIKGGRCIYQLSFFSTIEESAIWLFCEPVDDMTERYRDLTEACVLMFGLQYEAALTVLKSCPPCSIVTHHVLRAKLKDSTPLDLSFTSVASTIPVVVIKKKRRKSAAVLKTED